MSKLIFNNSKWKLPWDSYMAQYQNNNKRRDPVNAFIKLQLSFFSVIWIFHSATREKKESTYILTYVYTYKVNLNSNNCNKKKNQLLSSYWHLTVLTTEIYKVTNGISSGIKEIEPYNLRNFFLFKRKTNHPKTMCSE